MTIRTTSKTVVFRYPFMLRGLAVLQPAGTYQVETNEEQVEGISFPVFRPVVTLIHLCPTPDRPGITQMMSIDPRVLEQVLAHDGEMERRELSRGDGPEPTGIAQGWTGFFTYGASLVNAHG